MSTYIPIYFLYFLYISYIFLCTSLALLPHACRSPCWHLPAATWCAPCKKEMPSLDKLYKDKRFKNLKIFAVNMEEPNKLKTEKFFIDLNIKNLEIFFDESLSFVKKFQLRGVPTTVLINKSGKEFARIIGEVDFQDRKFVRWLAQYD